MAIYYMKPTAERHARANMGLMWRVQCDVDEDSSHELASIEFWVPEADNPGFMDVLVLHVGVLLREGLSVNVSKLEVK